MQEFHAFQVAPNKEHRLEIPEGCGFHLSVVSLPHNSTGRVTLYVSVDGKSLAVGTLDAQRNLLQISTDLIFNFEQKVLFHAKGSATVHCIGYRQQLDMDDEVPFGLEESDDDEEGRGHGAVSLPVEKAEKSMEEDDEEEESGDDDEDSDDGVADPADPTQVPSDDDEDDDDEEMDGDDEEDDEDDEDDEEEEDESNDEEEAVEPPTKAMRSEGRPSQQSQGRPSQQSQGRNSQQSQGRPSQQSQGRNSQQKGRRTQ